MMYTINEQKAVCVVVIWDFERIYIMYQMMIIDDETIVREGLKKLLPWEEYRFQICAEGIDGIDGYEKVMKYKPDLVLVDIKMPGMDGLELIRKTREEGFQGEFIILTGYSDFQFAKLAISYGVREYLLKPIDEDELSIHLQKVSEEFDKKKNLAEYYSLNELKARQDLIRCLLLYIEDKEELRKQFKRYHVNFEYDTFCVAMLCNCNPADNGLVEYPSEEKLAIMISGLHAVESVCIEDKWIIICKGETYHECAQKLRANNRKLKKIFGEEYFIAIGHNVIHWEDLHYSYEAAKLLTEYQYVFRDDEYITIKALEASETLPSVNVVDSLSDLIEVGDSEGIKSALDEFGVFCKKTLMKESEVKIFMTHHLYQLKATLEEQYEEKKNQFPDYELLMDHIRSSTALGQLLSFIQIYCNKISSIIALSGSNNVIKRLNAYLEKNYSKDIKLETLAKIFNYNSAYLGKIFKKEMGESFNNVLDKIRIENAKKLLIETDLKVYQVSERVGYSNIDYFYSKFKRYVGISPKEFKKAVNKE